MKRKNKKIKIFVIIILTLAVIRLTLPSAIKMGLNSYLDDFSPSISARISDVDLAVIRGSITLEAITGKVKGTNSEFLSVRSANMNLFWSDLFKGKIASNVLIDNIELNVTKDLIPAIQKHLASMPPQKKETEPMDITIRRFDIINSGVKTEFIKSVTNADNTLFTDIKARAANITMHPDAPPIPLSLQGKLLNSGQFKVEGEANVAAKSWTVDSELLKFDMTEMNQFLKNNVPVTFTKGELDLYSEAKSEGETITGYIKPFIKSLDVIKTNENFIGPKHWLIEIVTALSNVTLKADEVVATRIPFSYNKTFKVDGSESLAKVFEHGFIQEQTRGIENSIELKQSQEEK